MTVLYVTGEESGAQVALRARRLGLDGTQVRVLAEIQLEKILCRDRGRSAGLLRHRFDPDAVLGAAHLGAGLGGAGARMRGAADAHGQGAAAAAMVLVGHVTKDGTLAGPRVLEHIVDTVLYFEGDTHSSFRLVRAIKNRFGAVNEIGVFAMTEKGLKGVANPSAIFLSTHGEPVPGSLRAGHAGRHAAAAGGDPGAGRQRRAEPAAAVGGPGPRPPGDAAGGAAPPCRRVVHGPGRVRQRRRRRAHQRAGRRPGGAAGDPRSACAASRCRAVSSPSAKSAWPARCGRRRAARSV